MNTITIGKLAFNWFVTLAVFVIATVMITGRSVIDGSFDLPAGLEAAWEAYGGWTLIAVLGTLIVLGSILYAFNRVQDTDYKGDKRKKITHQVIATIVIIVIAIVGIAWLLPVIGSNLASFIAILIALVVVTVATVLTSLLKTKVVSKPTTTP
ncbi:MAG: hypothetical protein WAQ27_02470 [Candidatus Microsaccharimonas sp.]